MSDDQEEIEEAEEVDAEPTPSAIVEEEELDEIVEVLEEEEELDDDYASDESDETALIGFGFRIEGESEESSEEDEGY